MGHEIHSRHVSRNRSPSAPRSAARGTGRATRFSSPSPGRTFGTAHPVSLSATDPGRSSASSGGQTHNSAAKQLFGTGLIVRSSYGIGRLKHQRNRPLLAEPTTISQPSAPALFALWATLSES